MYKRISVPLGLSLLMLTTAYGTNGYKMIAAGDKVGTAGAGVAFAMDATDTSLNPALLSRLDNQFDIFLGVFHPERYKDTSGATTSPALGYPQFGNPKGKQYTHKENFPDGSLGLRYEKCGWSYGVSLTGSGGMHTNFPSSRINPAYLNPPGNYDKGVAYRIGNLHFGVAHKFFDDKISIGISPFVSYSDFKSDSAKAPAGPNQPFPETSGHNHMDRAWGGGIRAGIDWKITNCVTVALAGQTPTWYQRFDKYRDILISKFNFPANVTTGIAWKIVNGSTLLFDYEYIHYRGTKLLKTNPQQGGFGWKNMNVIKVGFVQDFMDNKLTARIGYNYGKSPIAKNKVFANVIAPAVVEHHIAAGLTYRHSKAHAFTVQGYYVPMKSERDPGTGDQYSQFGKGTKIGMRQWDIQAGYKFSF